MSRFVEKITLPSAQMRHRKCKGSSFGFYAVWARRSCRKRGVEIEIEAFVQLQFVFEHFDYMHFVIPLEMDLAEVIFIQEVVSGDQALIIIGKTNIVWSGVKAQVDDSALQGVFRFTDVEHADLARLERCEDQALATAWHCQNLRHSSANWYFNVGNDRLAIEYVFVSSVKRIDKVDVSIEHSCSKGAAEGVAWNQLNVHRADRLGDLNGANDSPACKVPNSNCTA